MNLSPLAELLHLHGYGIYVWPAYAAMLAGLLAEPWLIRRRLARARDLARQQWRMTEPDDDGASAWGPTRAPQELP